jgi:hypothetical protein
MSVFLVMLELLPALILLNTAALLVRRSVLVVVWEEAPAIMVSALVIRASRVRIVPPLIKQGDK